MNAVIIFPSILLDVIHLVIQPYASRYVVGGIGQIETVARFEERIPQILRDSNIFPRPSITPGVNTVIPYQKIPGRFPNTPYGIAAIHSAHVYVLWTTDSRGRVGSSDEPFSRLTPWLVYARGMGGGSRKKAEAMQSKLTLTAGIWNNAEERDPWDSPLLECIIILRPRYARVRQKHSQSNIWEPPV
ncbi:hypothetical protein EI94DRAFT_1707513 [Lactarius quietus]|nr:hypothetical protein EI94DRAFT_1707513 [Lactarius quietus]